MATATYMLVELFWLGSRRGVIILCKFYSELLEGQINNSILFITPSVNPTDSSHIKAAFQSMLPGIMYFYS